MYGANNACQKIKHFPKSPLKEFRKYGQFGHFFDASSNLVDHVYGANNGCQKIKHFPNSPLKEFRNFFQIW
jgi:hypothetical protein